MNLRHFSIPFFLFLFLCLGCGETAQGYRVAEGAACGTTRQTQPGQGRWDPDKVTVTTRKCDTDLVCLNAKCVEACPEKMEYDCKKGICECVNIFPKIGEVCDTRKCEPGLLCAMIRDEEPSQRCVTIEELFCQTESDCALGVCRPNGLCADRILGDPCQTTAQCVAGECKSEILETEKFCE